MIDLQIYDATSSFKEISQSFLTKIININIRESLNGEADSITINLKNNKNSSDFWPPSFYEDRDFSLQFVIDGVNFGVFNFDEIDFDYTSEGDFITMRGLIAPVTTGKSIYQQVRKVYGLNSLENILKDIANLANINLDYFFDDFKLKIQISNEFIFNIFTRLAEKYGAVVKIYRDNGSDKYNIAFYGLKYLAENAKLLKQSEIAKTLERGKGLISIDKLVMDNTKLTSINFKLQTNRKELKVIYYDPMSTRTYTKISKNKSRLIIADSRRDHEIVKVTSKSEADIVARKVEEEPEIIGEISSRWNKDFLSGNIIEFKNYDTFSGYYLINDTNHTFSSDGNDSFISFQKLPNENIL